MSEKDNYLQNTDISTGKDTHIQTSIMLTMQPTPVPAQKPLDKVKEPPAKKRTREREDR